MVFTYMKKFQIIKLKLSTLNNHLQLKNATFGCEINQNQNFIININFKEMIIWTVVL